jgi:hypothetical protein
MLFLVGLLLVVAVGGATAGVVTVLDLDEEDAGGTGGDGTSPTVGTGTTLPPLRADQIEVTGVAVGVTVEGVDVDPVPSPMEVTVAAEVADRGATLRDVEVDGEITDVAWDGGRPFRLLGAELGIRGRGVNLFASANAVTIGFPDEAVHELVAGSYGLETPVAIGSGLARPQDSVAFEATDGSTVVFRGNATTAMLPQAFEFDATTGRVLLQGQLGVRRPDGTAVEATSVELPTGIYTITFTPRADLSGYDVEALLQGEVLVT